MSSKRVLLSESEMPTAWYNLQADLPEPVPPPLHPATQQPIGPADLEPIFAKAADRPGGEPGALDRDSRRGPARTTPFGVRRPWCARRTLEKALKTPARIYFKDESHSPPGSHKPNTAVPQAYYNKMEGINRLTDRDRRRAMGQSPWPSPARQFDIKCKVYMVKVSYQQKPYRRSMMHMWGGEVTPSPSNETKAGRQILAADPDCPGSLGIAISEAVEAAVDPRRHQVHARQRAQPRDAAPDGHRPGGREADEDRRRLSRRGDRLRRRRQQFRRAGLPLPAPQDRRARTSASWPASRSPARR